jgi:hypothetical protein
MVALLRDCVWKIEKQVIPSIQSCSIAVKDAIRRFSEKETEKGHAAAQGGKTGIVSKLRPPGY